ncbi:MAG TPA: sulfatase-like hydrolase/transferase [Candidatus Hydrogenedentes bacterium]|nr:sulfatase-like hydrolase/transferase [Candidatus Hydrogenedentota bacterium]HPG65830.1 sulfatase-like hydrolase/transferase [Candidatus Hydrogenedentota bacterium]
MARPNVIVILSDQHRWDCAGFAGNPDVRTPNLDALAAHGVVFDQTVCQFPLCVPSRSTLLTGQYPSTHGVLGNRQGLPTSSTTLPATLKASGYNTAAIGKMHFNPPRADYGFDVMQLAEQDGHGRYVDDYHAWLKEQGVLDEMDVWDQVDRDSAPKRYWDTFGAMTSNLSEAQHSTTWIGNMAVRFVQSAREPFFLFVGFIKPHHPFDPPARWSRIYAPRQLTLPPGWCLPVPKADACHGGFFDPAKMTEARFRRVLAHYYASISHMDHQIGRVLATLTGRGFTNNLIVYASDHGDYMGQHGLIIKGGAKMYDALIRVPLIIAGAVGQRRGVADDTLAQLTDIMPTILDTAGLDAPSCIEGRTLRPQLEGAQSVLRDVAYCEGPDGIRIARTKRHKLVESPREELKAFYDLERDPHEFENLYGRPEAARGQAELTAALEEIARRPGVGG